MNSVRDVAMSTGSLVNTSTVSTAQIDQRVINLRAFQEKYDAMLYLVEFMASLNLIGVKNPRQTKKMDELKSLVAQTRNGLGLGRTEFRFDGCTNQSKVEPRE